MSLTSVLKQENIANRFNEVLKYPILNSKDKPKVVPLTQHYSVVGTAFDYLLRFYLRKRNVDALVHEWIADRAVFEIGSRFPADYNDAVKILNEAKDNYFSYIRRKYANIGGNIPRELIVSTLKLAKLDIFFRSGYYKGINDISEVCRDDIRDLKKLCKIIDDDIWQSGVTYILNPNFGKGSKLVGGADADIIMDDILIDIKTVKNLVVKKEYINQLIGYYILSLIGGVNMKVNGFFNTKIESAKIKKVGIYFSRFGVLKVYNIEEIISEKESNELKKWLVEKCKH